MPGDDLEISAGVGAYSKAAKPVISIAGSTLPLEADGRAVYKTKASGSGSRTVPVVVKYTTPKGDVETKTFDVKYTVGTPGGAAVMPDKMNVFYIGVDNPVSISVPGFPAEKTSATITGGTITKDGKGGWVVNETTMGNVDVNVSVQMPDGTTKVMGKKTFRVKQIPPPYAQIGGLAAGTVAAGAFKSQTFMIAKLDNFDFELTFPIVSYDVQYAPYKQDLAAPRHVNGGNLSQISDLLSKAKIHDSYYFDNIAVKMPGGVVRKIQSIAYRIN